MIIDCDTCAVRDILRRLRHGGAARSQAGPVELDSAEQQALGRSPAVACCPRCGWRAPTGPTSGGPPRSAIA